MTEDVEGKMNQIILEAAKQELKWDSESQLHDHSRWKDELRERLWKELGVDLEAYT